MGAQGTRAPRRTAPDRVRVLGLLLLVGGLVGLSVWVGTAWYAADHGTVADGSLAARIEVAGDGSAPGDHDRLSGRDHRGRVVWEGTQAELDEILSEGRAERQDELRHDWLFPSLTAVAAGLVVLAWDRSHTAAAP